MIVLLLIIRLINFNINIINISAANNNFIEIINNITIIYFVKSCLCGDMMAWRIKISAEKFS